MAQFLDCRDAFLGLQLTILWMKQYRMAQPMALWTSISSVQMTIPKCFMAVQSNVKLNTFFLNRARNQ